MTQISNMVLLRYEYKTDENIVKAAQDMWREREKSLFNDKLPENTVNFIKTDVENEKSIFLSVEDNGTYVPIMTFYFPSDFGVLKDEYNMYSSPCASQVIIDLHTAKELVQAIDYLLAGNYSEQFELILNNYYIKKFGELLPLYDFRYAKIDELNSVEINEFTQSGNYILKKLQTILNAYIWLEAENSLHTFKYKLIYQI